MSSPARCPGCGRPDALIGLGERRDRPHRWRPWVSTVTLIYLCAQCDALVEESNCLGCQARAGGDQGVR
jgi:hypothetical protein